MGQIIQNIITAKAIQKPDPVASEVAFDGGVMITETDKAGIITYANKKFIEMTGYTKDELIGSPHSINRHPDMPHAAFKLMWDALKKGEYFEGYVKNMRSDGQYYYVIVWVKPKYDENGNLTGYIAGRKIPDNDAMQKALDLYKELKIAEDAQ